MTDPIVTNDNEAIQQVRQMVTAAWTSHALYVAAHLQIPDLVAAGPKHSDEIAKATGCDAESMFRFLRAVASVGVLSEVAPKQFALGPLGRPLCRNTPGSVHQLTIWYGKYVQPVWNRLLESLQTGKEVFPKVYGADLWDFFAANPEPANVFNEAMGATEWRDQAAIVEAYDFKGITRLVDVGGGLGTMLAAILRAHPEMRGVVVDLPAALKGTADHMQSAGVADRCEIVEGSAFDALPKGDGYLLSSVLHLLDDEKGEKALRRVNEAMDPGGKLLILDRVLPPGDEPYFGKFLDLTMLVMMGGRERSADEYRALYERTGFKVNRIVPMPFFAAGIGLSIVEGVRP